MKSFSERNPVVIGAVGVGMTAIITLASLNYDRLPLVDDTTSYTAYLAEAGGLNPGAAVQVSGLRVGKVEALNLDGPQVLVRFNVDRGVMVGDRSEAAVKTKTVLGAKILELTPRGENRLTSPIPVERTQSAYQLPDALGDLTLTISGLDTDQLSRSLTVLSETFKDTPPALSAALQGVSRFSETLNARDERLRTLLANANKAATVLGERSDQIVQLVHDTDAVLAALVEQGAALDQVSVSVSALAKQIGGFIEESRNTFKPALEKLNGLLAIIDTRKRRCSLRLRNSTPT